MINYSFKLKAKVINDYLSEIYIFQSIWVFRYIPNKFIKPAWNKNENWLSRGSLSYFAYLAELDNTSNLRQFELQLAQIDGHSVPAKFQFLWKAASFNHPNLTVLIYLNAKKKFKPSKWSELFKLNKLSQSFLSSVY